MPLRDFKCKSCEMTQERYYTTATLPVCTCGGTLEVLPLSTSTHRKTGIFPFTSPHIDGTGKPITVESIGHLRQIERQYGVVLSAFSQEPSNSDPIKDPPRHRIGGRE